MGSIKDNAGKEVIGDRVILYIHGETAKSEHTNIDLTFQAVLSSSPPWTPIDIKYNGMRAKPELERSAPRIVSLHNTLSYVFL